MPGEHLSMRWMNLYLSISRKLEEAVSLGTARVNHSHFGYDKNYSFKDQINDKKIKHKQYRFSHETNFWSCSVQRRTFWHVRPTNT